MKAERKIYYSQSVEKEDYIILIRESKKIGLNVQQLVTTLIKKYTSKKIIK